jgi:hypothetical protein
MEVPGGGVHEHRVSGKISGQACQISHGAGIVGPVPEHEVVFHVGAFAGTPETVSSPIVFPNRMLFR